MMVSVPFTQAASLLSVDAKTLRQWLKQANLSLHQNPTDARVKCLTHEQIQFLADLHGRVLPIPDAPALPSSEARSVSVPDANLQEKVIQLEARIETIQAQIAQLALQLLQERVPRTEHRLLTLEATFSSATGRPLQLPAQSVPDQQPAEVPAPHPAEKRSSLIPLIAYTASGGYVLICPKEGELPITPDTAEWFTWLASLSSFRFVGRSGRFSARRGDYNRRPKRSWYARRAIHQKHYTKYIGVSEHITIDRLEHIAAAFQAYAT